MRFFSSRFSAVISAITDFIRDNSARRRSSFALGRSACVSNTAPADFSSRLRQA
jgi:hypothetical protein